MESAEIHEYGKRISDFVIKVTNQPLLARFICEFFKVSVHFPLAVSPQRCNVMTTQFFNSLFFKRLSAYRKCVRLETVPLGDDTFISKSPRRE